MDCAIHLLNYWGHMGQWAISCLPFCRIENRFWPGRMTTLGKSRTHSQFCRIFVLCLRNGWSQAVWSLKRYKAPWDWYQCLLDCSVLRIVTIVVCCPQTCENDPLCRRLRLQDIISSSYQRFTKYPLLLEGIQTNTPSKFHELNFCHQENRIDELSLRLFASLLPSVCRHQSH